MRTFDVAVVGGGAAGMMAAITAAASGARTALIEPNEKLGRKVYISGKGRCNLTNDCTPQEMLQNVPGNGRFLYSAVNRFPPAEVQNYFSGLGVPLKVERGRRVFPVSDRAADVVDALFEELKRRRVTILHERVARVLTERDRVCGVETENGVVFAPCVILATGGCSYPLTGSTGDGYRMAETCGHTIVPIRPSLIPLEEAGTDCAEMQGLSLRNVAVQLLDEKKKVHYREQGEMLFTHFGISGPLILSASAHVRDWEGKRWEVLIDLKPALDEQTLDQRLLRELGAQSNRTVTHVMETLLPRLMIPVILRRAEIDPDTRANEIRKEQRRRLLALMKRFAVPIAGPRPVEEAIVTAGGVKVSEVDPKTMMSKKLPGLFFAGELLDVDAYTGGFNLQIAWCTGRAAGEASAQFAMEEKL